jgi:hypothetical protein
VPVIKLTSKFKVGEEDNKCGIYHIIITVVFIIPRKFLLTVALLWAYCYSNMFRI